MRRAAAGILALIAAACARQAGPAPAAPPVPEPPGALEIRVEPNPVLAIPAGESTWEFPFTLTVAETGGGSVEITRVGIEVFTVGGLKIYGSELTASEIDRRGYPRRLEPFGEVRYTMRPRQRVPDERLFGNFWGELWAEGVDSGGRRIETRTRVTIRRGE
ncbi:MAG: hypothetical protein ACRD2J_02895 [Thermoanaerobaculia bacterium]